MANIKGKKNVKGIQTTNTGTKPPTPINMGSDKTSISNGPPDRGKNTKAYTIYRSSGR